MSEIFKKKFDKLFSILNEFQKETEKVNAESEAYKNFDRIHSSLVEEVNEILKTHFAIAYSEIHEDRLKDWEKIGGGAFGEVLITPEPLALKKIERTLDKGKIDNIHEEILKEIETLSILNHDNIVAYRGWGMIRDGDKQLYCLAMEYIDKNLKSYIKEHEVDGSKGLTSRITWEIGKQVAQALKYLHSLNITHNDIKPDNILIDTKPVPPQAKLCDFGLAGHSYGSTSKKKMSPDELSQAFPDVAKEVKLGHIRFQYYVNEEEGGPLELTKEQLRLNDIFAYACVILNCKSGLQPFHSQYTYALNASSIKYDNKLFVVSPSEGERLMRGIGLPKEVKGSGLEELIVLCFNAPQESLNAIQSDETINKDLTKQRITSFRDIIGRFFNMDNPFQLSTKGDFFTCGFLTETNIFVADSFVPEKPSEEPGDPNEMSYMRDELICEVVVPLSSNGKDVILPSLCYPEDSDTRTKYEENIIKFEKMARKKVIDDNPMLALKRLITSRPGREETQHAELCFMESRYCRHRAMRDIWKVLENDHKLRITGESSLAEVNKVFSTSFGLHVAILTNEGAGRPKKFVFTKRSTKTGVASPGSYTCGAVESCSVKDYLNGENLERHLAYLENKRREGSAVSFNYAQFFDGEEESESSVEAEVESVVIKRKYETQYVSLVDTAVRGMEEELGLELYDSDKDAVMLNTLYLKFDNHEWGLCGFVDLTNPKIREENRLSFSELLAAFSSGPRDRFEHHGIEGVDFELNTMVSWIRENHNYLASSAKIAVVKVLKAFFGTVAVDKAFCAV